jgi:hypothetical protein
VPTLPAPPQSPFGDSLLGLSFTMIDHKALCAFRRRLRRKAVWAVITSSHHELTEAVQVYRPYELPGKAEPSWIIWRSVAGVWVQDREDGPLGEPVELAEALEFVEAVLKTELRNAIRAIPQAVVPRLPKQFCWTCPVSWRGESLGSGYLA